MKYRAVGKKCAVNLEDLKLPMGNDEVLEILKEKGFRKVNLCILELTISLLFFSKYRRGAPMSEAPSVVDCSSLIKYVYGERGIWLPRRSIQQREMGQEVKFEDIHAGDVVFTSGLKDYYWDDPRDGVGHVGLAMGGGNVIHAANSKVNLSETSLEEFVAGGKFRGARRFDACTSKVITLEAPPNWDVEISDDFRWIVLQSL